MRRIHLDLSERIVDIAMAQRADHAVGAGHLPSSSLNIGSFLLAEFTFAERQLTTDDG